MYGKHYREPYFLADRGYIMNVNHCYTAPLDTTIPREWTMIVDYGYVMALNHRYIDPYWHDESIP